MSQLTMSNCKNFFHSDFAQSKTWKSEITEERTANENMLKSRISEIEKKINAAYELMISPTECEEPTQTKRPTQNKNKTEESGYFTRNCDTIEQPGSSRDQQSLEAIPFELDWDQGRLVIDGACEQNLFRKKRKCRNPRKTSISKG